MTRSETLQSGLAALGTFASRRPMRARTVCSFLLRAAFALFVPASTAWAWFDPSHEDIDLFLVNPATSPARPNVLILLDNTANWNTPFDDEKQALATVVNGLNDHFNVGLMMFPETGSPNDNVDGGYVRFGVRQMTATAKDRLVDLITDFHKLNDKGNNATFSLLMYEAYAYYAGIEARAGFGKIKRDAGGNFKWNPYAFDIPVNALTTMLSKNYNSPITEGCQKNYIILISNGPANDNSSSLAQAQSLLAGILNATPSTINIAPPDDGSENNWTDEYAKYMAEGDCKPPASDGAQHVFTYVVEINPGTQNQDRAHTALMKSAANVGKGRYFAVSSGSGGVEIVDTLNTIFAEIQAVNSVFAATTLPVSINVRGTNANQVYMGVFRPERNALPRWVGNLKHYQVGINRLTNPPELFLADAAGARAENRTAGFILPDARSFWTTPSTYWAFKGTYEDNDLGRESDAPDGPIVEKGGAGQKLRATNPANRKLYTCAGGCSADAALSANTFTTGNNLITAAALGVSTSTERTDIIEWVRGVDLDDENLNGITTDARPSIHGDVLHSQPAVINYNRSGGDDDNDVVIFYGANDGVFRAVTGGTAGGDELWGFIAPEHYGKLKRLRANGPAIGSANKKPYFFDGSVSSYTHDANGDGRLIASEGDKVFLFLSMRRGGRMVYAFDASDPADPRFMWKKGCPVENDNSGCDTGFAELGQTWSDPSIAFLRKYGANAPVLVIGAGYDAAVEDVPPCLITAADADSVSTTVGGIVSYALNGSCTVIGGTTQTINRSQGRGVFLINALNGALLWRFGPDASANTSVAGMSYSIAGKVVALNRDRDISRPVNGFENIIGGYVDRLYATDTGGSIWRMDVASADTSEWRISKLASLGGSGTNKRKFPHRVDVVYARDAEGVPYDAVLVGSGDREHPFDASVANRFYMIKDRNVAPVAPVTAPTTITESTLYNATGNCLQQCTGSALQAAELALQSSDGWYFNLRAGEKVVAPATTVAGTVFFSTNEPGVDDCGSNLGTAREYQVSYKNATALRDLDPGQGLNQADRSSVQPGGGFPPEHQPFLMDFSTEHGEQYEQGVISGTDVNRVDAVPFGARLRTFWHKRMD